ncbi:pepsin/retropepsin-like aspartic protease family protein [Cognatitamlana onchidii]|uniref:pepsin/retropepsin-like aspartic protease family protein n=1 Tax=Cognatitamlana onchidii TaxID=2562860 RepID=UPI001455EC1F|nr:pepsin/retropepsin-like aspartic protease family protein [Algibacter onchidii]
MLLLSILLFFKCGFLLNAHNSTSPPIIFSKAEKIDQYTTRIPFKLVDHLIVVNAEIYNQKGNFIIDTGSESMILNEVHFPKLYNQQNVSIHATGILQNVENNYQKRIKTFILENFSLENKTAHIINLSAIEKSKKVKILGIIGYNILKDYEVFIDMYLNQITLTKVDSFGNKMNKHLYLEKISDSIPFKLKGHTITVKGTINHEDATFGIDSAAEFNQINKRISKKALKYFIPKNRLKLSGIGGKKIEVLAGKLHRVKLSESTYFGPMVTVLTNLNKINEAFGVSLDGILGYEFFAQKRTIINYQKEQLSFIDFPILFH